MDLLLIQNKCLNLELPDWLAGYIIIAIIIELFLSIGVWYERSFTYGIIGGILLVSFGAILTIISLIMRYSTDCGCGLYGHNEYGILFQKLIILSILNFLHRSRHQLYPTSINEI